MKKVFGILLAMVLPMMVLADTYPALWKKVAEAQSKDLPKTQMQWLDQIIAKAQGGSDYGQLLKAQLMRAAVQTQVAPDSARAELERIEDREAAAKDPALKAVYATVLGKLYAQRVGGDDDEAKSRQWFAEALKQPEVLARRRCADYEPAVVTGVDSKIFGDDLLHVIGMEAGAYATLHDYYEQHGNRPAACISACLELRNNREVDTRVARKSRYLQTTDSLLQVYGDLSEAGELAIERYQFLDDATDVTADDRVSYINYALSKWGEWPRMNILRNAMSALRQPMFSINIGDGMALPQTDRLVRINVIRNIGTLTVNIYRAQVDGDCTLDPSEADDWAKLQKTLNPTPVQTLEKRYVGQPAWKENYDSLVIKGLPVGVYVLEATTDNAKVQPQRILLRVSGLFVMTQALPDRKIRFVVADATSGEAVAGAHLRLKMRAYDDNENAQSTDLVTDKNGEAYYTYDKRAPQTVYAYTDADKACSERTVYTDYRYWTNNRTQQSTRLFTDRSIYRPGQQVHVAVLAYEKDNDALKTTPQTDKQITLTLRDANRKVVAEQTVTTDRYGSASADFTLPQTGLTGTFTVVDDNRSTARFKVEEYKRPTFQVTCEPFKDSYQPGDTVVVRGWAKQYAGVPVQGAHVTYEVSRRAALWWGARTSQGTTPLLADSAVTAADGSFLMKLPMVYPDDVDLSRAAYYHVVAKAKVTDGAGESHEAQTSLALSNRAAALSVNLPAQSLRDSLKSFTATLTNLDGQPIDGTATYRFDEHAWKTIEVNKPVAIDDKLSSGKHVLEVICGQDTVKSSVIVFSYSDKKPVIQTADWFHISQRQFPADGSPVYLQVGSSDKETTVYYSAFTADKILTQGVKKIGDEVITRKLTYKEEYGDGITITMAWVKNGKMYRHEASITRPVPDNTLRLTWKTFRDRLTPGQKEQWTLHIETPQGKPATAQLLAVMYDKSLDAIASHKWNFSLAYSSFVPSAWWQGGSHKAVGVYGFETYRPLNEHTLDFSHLNTDMLEFATPYTFRYHAPMLMMARQDRNMSVAQAETSTVGVKQLANKVADADLSMRIAGQSLTADDTHEGAAADGTVASATQVRENLSETAFFYPALTTDASGNVNISFTLPESVTTWRFMALAHDAAFQYGQTEAEAVAQKTVMVQPNLPRFIRQGDHTAVACRITNTSDKNATGKARLQLVCPETDKVVEEFTAPFEVAAGATAVVEFSIDANRLAAAADGTTLFIVRTLAEGKGFSDGEQQYVPLLTDKELVTTTLPFTLTGAGVKTLDISKLFPTSDKHNRLTAEYTDNPAWLMVQALPTVANPSEHNAVSLATAVYANTIARQLLAADPAIGRTIKQWQAEQAGETTLESSLQKNAELKTMLLSETPWVADAASETEQRQRLAGYLDESAVDYRLQTFTGKLQALQRTDGGFGWWTDMPSSKYMTMEVATILARLNVLTGQTDNKAMLDAAFAYLDRKVADEVNELKKEEQKKHAAATTPSEFACDYLYACALTDRQPTADVRYLLNLLEKSTRRLSVYGKARTAVVLAQYGREARAKEYLQSLNEYAVYKEDMGRYYDTQRALYSWKDYRIPTQVAAIEALRRLSPTDTVTIRDMRRWLLQAKRTQAWDTPINTVDAVCAFLAGADGKADMRQLTTAPAATLQLDGRSLALPKATAGLGYVKTSVAAPTASTFTVQKTSTGTSWGALYAQHWQKASDVEAQSSGLKVKREVMVQGQVVDTQKQPLKVGDKVTVRITITADRDYDFVQVQDKRAACLEPAAQLSGYRWGYYCAPKDNVTNYYFDLMAKGEHVIETDYYVDRQGDYASGICTAQCAYSPEFAGREGAKHFTIIR